MVEAEEEVHCGLGGENMFASSSSSSSPKSSSMFTMASTNDDSGMMEDLERERGAGRARRVEDGPALVGEGVLHSTTSSTRLAHMVVTASSRVGEGLEDLEDEDSRLMKWSLYLKMVEVASSTLSVR